MAAVVDALINQQALMIAYVDDFKLMFIITPGAAPFLLLLRCRLRGVPAAPVVHAD